MKIIKRLLLMAFVLTLLAFGGVYFAVTASLPVLEGEWGGHPLTQAVKIERDSHGVPTISAANDADRAYALGWLHGQDRYFQMDLLRRNAAGELSELFGSAALDWDREMRTHRFRARARQTIEALPEAQRTVIDSYTAGVNEGVASLGARPFEYLLLMQSVRPWSAEDSLLCLYSMYVDLQDHDGSYERSLDFMQTQLPADWFEFLRPQPADIGDDSKFHWEAPLAGDVTTRLALPEMPIAALLNGLAPGHTLAAYHWADEGIPGSNNWGVAGSRSHHGAAIVADDMHLGIRVPNTWYRASWYLEDGRRVTGATLPGTPAMVVGSNEKFAWGFTNTYGDWSEVVRLVTDDRRSQYLTPTGWREFDYHEEIIMVNNHPNPFTVRETIWGPVIGEDEQGNLLAYRWIAHDQQGANFEIMELSKALSSAEALAIASRSGVPAQNMMLADAEGNLSWSVFGAIPDRLWLDKQWVQDWSQQDGNWQGYRAAEDYPRVVADELDGYLWTANSQVLMDQRYPLIGDGGYDIGIRAGTIAERLAAKTKLNEADLLAIQLDTENRLLGRWADHLRDVVDIQPEPVFAAELLAILDEWDGHAEVSSVSYRLVSAYRQAVLENSLGPVYQALTLKDYQGFSVKRIDNFIDNPLWLLISEQPDHLLNPAFVSWEALLLNSARTAFSELTLNGLPADEATWGLAHQLHLQHPLSRAVPGLGYFLDMPQQAIAGDRKNVVRIQGRAFGASQRMVVAPGREADGIFHMPTGQSGHPFSEFYQAGHQDWVEGNPSPFLPQQTIYHLKLLPAAHN
ncbi:penicillin acylase family protein [Corallincola spongiicola]|uniref:Penicillin acylase family protein n=1 Tax=Corallincola spongiicola TaxID=2520508 RepID=A0ABY1WT93_9GAMM|nr:penicillin acylase family protein [Corallincola spongiicola]TAA47958.1 penicillin acylase family protein [Corallincola spongiicola]